MSDKEPLSWFGALRRNDVPAIRKWIAEGADIDAPIPLKPTDSKWPPLYVAALGGKSEGVRVLLEAGADPNVLQALPDQPTEGYTYRFDSPLIAAAGHGSAEAVRLLLDAGADIAYCGPISDSALAEAIHLADGKKFLDVIRLLLDRGCAADYTPTGRSLLISAAWNRNCRGIISELVKRGADPNAIDQRWG
ncbi:MAG TPA: ankyrin repeat domain-containing protein, partial [Pirellulaceae bacterium]|nr:ankyrin repeat domain-containing protein [Pirellulaceae bacterium]